MKALIGRAPGEEINRVRFARVERLLAETDFTLDEIAARTGFAHTQYMAEAFRKRAGITPGSTPLPCSSTSSVIRAFILSSLMSKASAPFSTGAMIRQPVI